jgi:CheY-like chemotaxis protein
VLDASRVLRDDPQVGPGTPILLITAGRPSTAEHHAALRAGVWEYLQLPFNAEEVGAIDPRAVSVNRSGEVVDLLLGHSCNYTVGIKGCQTVQGGLRATHPSP